MVIHLTADYDVQLQQIYADGGPSPDDLVNEAVKSYLCWRQDHTRAVNEGLAAADAGLLVEQEAVRQRIEDILAR